MASFTRLQLENWLKGIEVKGRVIDFGGSQASLKGRTKSWNADCYLIADLPKFKPDIPIDLNYGSISWANGSCEVFEVDKETDSWGKTLFECELFDTAFCLEVSEYLHNPSTALNNIYASLNIGGILYMSFHFVYGVHPPHKTDYLRYTPDGVDKLMEEAGFKVLEHKHRFTERMGLGVFYTAEGMRIDKRVNHNIIGSLVKCQKI